MLARGVTQKLTRSQQDGLDCIVALYRLDFEPEQIRYVLNIPIHPPLPELPDVEAEALNASSRIRVTNCERFGVRIEVILNEAIESGQTIFVECSITSPVKQQAKANL